MVQEGVQPLANELRHLMTEVQAARQEGSKLETRLTGSHPRHSPLAPVHSRHLPGRPIFDRSRLTVENG